ncbi:MAG: carbon monoxide dehydrogenase [Methanomassiliicoccaceae archaeon]|jgi:hypothetical protein|nr:carbon monoxide dehydrogenase [Methanomassiliicoccaceae archaeon]
MSECGCGGDPKEIRNIPTELRFGDRIGALKVRLGIGRDSYKIPPGLYSVGTPNGTSPVFVSANYKLTFDSLRKELGGLDCYILILDTKGINVWCAAGKGTFGTEELVNRIAKTGLSEVVSHRDLILPQLGAPGMCAHEVKRRSGFNVIYGPVRASDIKKFLAAGMEATPEMRTVKFTARDRTVLTPMEFIPGMKLSMLVFGMLFLANFIAKEPFGTHDLYIYLGAVIVGTVITPILLPIIPVSAFSLKGWILGVCWTAYAVWAYGWLPDDLLTAFGYLLVLPSLSAFFAMNFTGASTYTSFSGVIREMRMAVPIIFVTIAVGAVLLFIGRVI